MPSRPLSPVHHAALLFIIKSVQDIISKKLMVGLGIFIDFIEIVLLHRSPIQLIPSINTTGDQLSFLTRDQLGGKFYWVEDQV